MTRIDEAVLSASPGEMRIALLAKGRVIEFLIDRGDPAPGDVIEGRVVEVARRLGAAFVDIGEVMPAYLPKAAVLGEGTRLTVEVLVAARPEKGAEVRRMLPETPPIRRVALARVLADYPEIARVRIDDAAALPEARAIFPAAELAPRCFEESGAADAFELALTRRVLLAGGGSVVFDQTEAAMMVDIDGAGADPARVNPVALDEIARQLRLRSIGGHILIDAIPIRHRRMLPALLARLRAAVADDPAPVQVTGATPLGMIEVTRRRRGPSLAEQMLVHVGAALHPVAAGLAGLRALLHEAAIRPGASLSLAVSPAAARALRDRPRALAEAGRRLGRTVALVERHGLESFAVEELVR